MSAPQLRFTGDLLDELRQQVKDRPKLRLHVNPDSAMWIAISVANTHLDEHVQVVLDPGIAEAGLGWVEEISAKRWRAMRALVGHRVQVDTAELGRLVGTLVELSDDQVIIDPGGDENDRRYVRWLTIEAV